MQLKQPLLVILLYLVLLTGCNPVSNPPEQAAPSAAVAQPTLQISPLPAISSSPTGTAELVVPSPTAPLLPSATDTAAPTQTATPGPLTAQTLRWVDVYAGPGETYPVMVSIAGDIRFDAAARSSDSTWIQIHISEFQVGWVTAENVNLSADLSALLALDCPPSQNTPTPLSPCKKPGFPQNRSTGAS